MSINLGGSLRADLEKAISKAYNDAIKEGGEKTIGGDGDFKVNGVPYTIEVKKRSVFFGDKDKRF
jgi:hypothetical protein